MASNTTQLTIQINGREVENTLNGIGRQVGQLSRELRDLNRNDPNFRQRQAELTRARELYSELRNEINNVGDASQNLNSSLNDFSRNILGSIGLVGGVAGLSVAASELTRKAAELSDAQSNVMKTTQMTKEEVDELTASFDNLNTRTSKLDLLKIAEEGGRLGLPIDEIEEFVIWMDKSVVALGDSFTGGVSEIASTLGKLKMMFKETSDINVGEAYNKIGSAINELGANGVATEKNIAEFATRVGSMPEVLKPAISEALALGAAFEESGLDAEVASRAYSIVLQRASSETAEFAKVMGLPAEQVRAMINDNPLEFFLQFAEKLKGINPEATEMANILGSLKINADGANKVMGAASNNTNRFRESIALSNKAMAEGTSLTEEYNVKNENLAASVEKIEKRFYELATNPMLVTFITKVVEQFGLLIGAFDSGDKKASAFQKSLLFIVQSLAVVIVSLTSYRAGLLLTKLFTEGTYKSTLLYNLVLKAKAVTTKAITIVTAIYNLSLATLQRNTVAASAATATLNTVMRANPLGVVFALITAVIGAWITYKNTVESVSKKTRDSEEALLNEQVAVKKLQNELNLSNTSSNRRNEILKELIKIHPDIFKGLNIEKASHEELNIAINKGNDSLRERYRIQSAFEDVKDSNISVEKLKEDVGEYEKELTKLMWELQAKYNIEIPTSLKTATLEEQASWVKNKVVKDNKFVFDTNLGGIDRILGDLLQLNNRLSSANSELGKTVDFFNKINNSKISNLLPDSFAKKPETKTEKKTNKPVELTEEQKKEAEREVKRKKSEAEREAKRKQKEAAQAAKQEKQRRIYILKEILKAEDEFRKAKNEATSNYEKEDLERLKNGYDKEVKLLEFATREKVLQIHEEILQLEKIQAEFRDKAKEEDSKGNPEAANKFRKLADEQIELITFKNASILSEEEKGLLDLLTLSSKYKGVELEKRQKASDDHINAIRVKHNEELAEIMTLEEAKLILQSKYGVEQLNNLTTITDAKNELAKQQNKEMLQEQLAVFEQELSGIQKLLSDDAFNRENGLSQLLTDEDREKVVENLKAVGVAISEVKSGLTNAQNEDSEDTTDRDKNARSKVLSGIDLLGFSADAWGQAFEGLNTAKTEMEEFAAKIKLVEMAVQSVMAAWGMMSEAQNKALDRNLKKYEAASDRKKKTLKNQLDEGYISESTYNAQVQKLEEDLAAKRAEISYKQAMNEWKMQLVGGMANTALAVTGALGMKPWTPGNIALASIVGGLGLVQTGMIAANKPTKNNFYATGGKTTGLGYKDETGHEVAGTVHANEYVIPEWLRSDPVVARMEEFIESKRNGISQVPSPTLYASGGPVNPVVITNNTPIEQPNNDKLLEDIYEVLIDLKNNGVRLPRTMENAKKIQKDLKDYSDLVSRTQKK